MAGLALPPGSALPTVRSHLTAVDAKTKPQDWRGQAYFSVAGEKCGVLVRAGQTEASVDLARIAGLTPRCVICES